MMRGGLGLAAVAYLWASASADAPPMDAEVATSAPTVSEAVRAGRHLRLALPQGPVHVWIPPGYHPDGAATVVYVHGYYDRVDEAWVAHRLPEQFALAGGNALFIAPEAPIGVGQPVTFPDLLGLLQEVETRTGQWRGTGPLVAVGHSGAHRTVTRWLAEPLLDTVILIDALYGEQDTFATWLEASSEHRLVTVGDDTLRWTEELALTIPGTVTADHFPIAAESWTPAQRAARHLYVRSQFGHMALVTEGVALPWLLRLLPVERLSGTAWHEPLGESVPWVAPALPDLDEP